MKSILIEIYFAANILIAGIVIGQGGKYKNNLDRISTITIVLLFGSPVVLFGEIQDFFNDRINPLLQKWTQATFFYKFFFTDKFLTRLTVEQESYLQGRIHYLESLDRNYPNSLEIWCINMVLKNNHRIKNL